MDFVKTEKNKRDIIVAIVTVCLIIIIIILLFFAEDKSDQYNGKKVIKAEVVNTTNHYNISTFNYNDIEIKLTLKDNTTAIINLTETMVDKENKEIINKKEKKQKYINFTLTCYKQVINYDVILYYIPTAADIYTSGSINYLDFGAFPQSLISDRTLIDKFDTMLIPEQDYVIYKGDKYVRKQAKDLNTMKYRFINNEQIYHDISSTQQDYRNYKSRFSWSLVKRDNISVDEYDVFYYFKVDPIKWRVLQNTSSEMFLASEHILDVGEFQEDAALNTYEASLLRANLSTNYAPQMFIEPLLAKIKEENLDNKSFKNQTNTVQVNTTDKLFALSYNELINQDYTFKNNASVIEDDIRVFADNSRIAYYTDYGRISTLEMDTTITNYGAGKYWTRTPLLGIADDEHFYDWAFLVLYDGEINHMQYTSSQGLRPGIKLLMS